MYGIFTYIYHKDQPNEGKYTIHGSHGFGLGSHGSNFFINACESIVSVDVDPRRIPCNCRPTSQSCLLRFRMLCRGEVLWMVGLSPGKFERLVHLKKSTLENKLRRSFPATKNS